VQSRGEIEQPLRAPSVRAFQVATDELSGEPLSSSKNFSASNLRNGVSRFATDELSGEPLASSKNFSASNLRNGTSQFATDELSVGCLASLPNFSASNLGALRF